MSEPNGTEKKVLRYATRVLVIILTIVVILLIVVVWSNIRQDVDRQFDDLFGSSLPATDPAYIESVAGRSIAHMERNHDNFAQLS